MFAARGVAPAIKLDVPNPAAIPDFVLPMPKGQKDIGEYTSVLSAVGQLRSEVQNAQQELISLGETTFTTVNNTVNAKVTQFVNDATKPGRQRVATAYDGIVHTMEASEQAAQREVLKHSITGTKAVLEAKTKRSAEIKQKAAAANEGVKALIDAAKPKLPVLSMTDLHMMQVASGYAVNIKDGMKQAKPDQSAFTSGMIFVKYPDGTHGEIQLIGKHTLEVANIEHIPYDISIDKPLARGIDDKHLPEMKQITGPIESAIRAVNKDPIKKASYEAYLRDLYQHARNLELGIDSTPPHLPDGIDKTLSKEGLQHVYDQVEALKAKDKKVAAKPQDENPTDLTKTGATLQHGAAQGSESTGFEAEKNNAARVSQRAVERLSQLGPSERKPFEKVLGAAKTEVQRNMLERALAAGHSAHELDQLRAHMADMNDDAVARGLTGAGVIQFYHQSCVPTAYQIAIADVDPHYAFMLRQHPEMVMDAQREVLQQSGAPQTARPELGTPAFEAHTENLKHHLDDPSMGAKLRDQQGSYGAGTNGDAGIQPTAMVGSDLHKQLERATGHTYDVLTNATLPFDKPGTGQFADGQAPHNRVMAALDQQLPVIVGQLFPTGGLNADGSAQFMGHAIVLLSYKVIGDPPSQMVEYTTRDPGTGKVDKLVDKVMNLWGVQTIAVPQIGDAGSGKLAQIKKDAGVDATPDASHADPSKVNTGAVVDADKDASHAKHDDPKKTWDDRGKQTERPDPESVTDAHARRSKPVTAGKEGTDVTKWASPENRQAIPETVPLSRQEVRDLVMAKYGATLEPYLNRQKTADDAFLPLLEKLRNEEPGAGKTEEGRKRQDDYEKDWDRISAEVAKKDDRHDDSELRTFYNVVEKEDFKHIWAPAIGHLPLEQQARLMYMYREELKLMVRDLMSDENSKEVLYLRDRLGSGDRRGGRFEDLVDRNMGKAKGDENEALKMVIASSMKSNEKINLAKTGYADGIVPEVGNKIRGEAKDPARELDNVRAKNDAAIAAERSKTVSGSAGGGVTSMDDDVVVPHAKLQQEGNETRRKEINLADNKPMAIREGRPDELRSGLDDLWTDRHELASLLKKDPTSERIQTFKDRIAHAEATLAGLLRDPANKDHLLDPHVAFALAREAGGKPGSELAGELTGFVRKHVDEFRKAQDHARQGADPELRAKRETFEREIARAIISGPLAAAVNADLAVMCKKALDYIGKLPEDRQAKFLASLGAQADGGYAGAVLKGAHTGQNAMVMADVLLAGNVRERMMALGNFATAVAADMHANAKDFKNVAQQAASTGKEGFGADEVARYDARMKQYRIDQEKKKVDASVTNEKFAGDFLKPTSTEKSGDQLAYQTAKDQEMDAKIPSLPTGADGVFHNQLPQSPSEKVKAGQTGAGEASSLARQGMTVKEAQALGYNLSQREIDAAGGPDGVLPWLTGTIANVVDPSAAFIEEGAKASLPQKAGISGTTFRFMEASALLGGKPELARLAAIGALQMIDAHTIYEIANASKGFGLEFNPQRPYDHLGIDPDVLRQLALSTGTTYAELNGETMTAPPTPKE